MSAYILRRLLLVIPTLIGIMVVNFTLTQFVPGGPIEQIIAQMEGGGDVFEGISGGGGGELVDGGGSDYIGSRGLPPGFIEELEKEFGFDKPPLERFLSMMWNYVRFDFGQSYFRSISVFDLVMEKMPVSITLGLWTTLIAYAISIPLGIKKAVRDGSRFDAVTGMVVLVGYTIPPFVLGLVLLVLFGAARAFTGPTLQSLLPQIVPRDQLGKAIALNSSIMKIGVIGGPMLGGLLSLLSSVYAEDTLYLALVSISGLAVVLVWMAIAASQFSFRRQWLKAGHSASELTYRAPLYPVVPIAAFLFCALACIGIAFDPNQRIALYFGVPFVALCYLVHYLTHRTSGDAAKPVNPTPQEALDAR